MDTPKYEFKPFRPKRKIKIGFKDKVVSRLFWGRSKLYRNFIHFSVLIITAAIFFSGFTSRLFLSETQANVLSSGQQVVGDFDLLEQGGSIESILQASSISGFRIFEYTVQSGDTYDAIAASFGVTKESIKLSNLDKINYYDDNPSAGTVLRIPEINGLLIKVSEGDTLDGIMSTLTAGSRLDVVEINRLKSPNYELVPNSYLLVPDGAKNPPPPPIPTATYFGPVFSNIPIPGPGEAYFAGVGFIDPLYQCAGYGYSRGFSSWHNGVDLYGGYGCPISAAAGGTVTKAGWSSGGEGFVVHINHGNGVETLYWHGNGNIYVQVGESVQQGQRIMDMGCTGFCTGTHLHLSLRYNGAFIDPAPYIPYWRP